jgi:hypothetical protein
MWRLRFTLVSLVVTGLIVSAMPVEAQSCYPNCPTTPQPPSLTLSGPSSVANGQSISIVANGNNNGPAGTLTATASIANAGNSSGRESTNAAQVKGGGKAKAADIDIPSFDSVSGSGGIFRAIKAFFRSIFGPGFGGAPKKHKKKHHNKGNVATVSPSSQSANVGPGGAFSFVFTVTGQRRGTANLTVCVAVQGSSTAQTCRSTSIQVTK